MLTTADRIFKVLRDLLSVVSALAAILRIISELRLK